MKSTRRNFFGKFGLAIAALAAGVVVAKATKPKWTYSSPLSEKQSEILLKEPI